MLDSTSNIYDSFPISVEIFVVMFTFMDTCCMKKSFPNSQHGLKKYWFSFLKWDPTSNMLSIINSLKHNVPKWLDTL